MSEQLEFTDQIKSFLINAYQQTSPRSSFIPEEVTRIMREIGEGRVTGSICQGDRALVGIVPRGVLFRSGFYVSVREVLIEEDVVEAVISLPYKLLEGTSIPLALLVINPEKPVQNRILFIDAENEFTRGKKVNTLTEEGAERILSAFWWRSEVEDFSWLVRREDIEESEFSLDPHRYAPQMVKT